jgi:hypothetical protein
VSRVSTHTHTHTQVLVAAEGKLREELRREAGALASFCKADPDQLLIR